MTFNGPRGPILWRHNTRSKYYRHTNETCDTIYGTKDTLVAYTIAIVQNTQTLQFDQMQVALQTAQNHASIETPYQSRTNDLIHGEIPGGNSRMPGTS